MKAMHTIKAKAIDLEHAVIGEGEEVSKKAEDDAGKAASATVLVDDSETEKV